MYRWMTEAYELRFLSSTSFKSILMYMSFNCVAESLSSSGAALRRHKDAHEKRNRSQVEKQVKKTEAPWSFLTPGAYLYVPLVPSRRTCVEVGNGMCLSV